MTTKSESSVFHGLDITREVVTENNMLRNRVLVLNKKLFKESERADLAVAAQAYYKEETYAWRKRYPEMVVLQKHGGGAYVAKRQKPCVPRKQNIEPEKQDTAQGKQNYPKLALVEVAPHVFEYKLSEVDKTKIQNILDTFPGLVQEKPGTFDHEYLDDPDIYK